MKIRIRVNGRGLIIALPTRLLFSKTLLKFGLDMGRRYSAAVPEIPPAAIDALCREIRRIKKTHRRWELVHIQSADGQEVRILL